MGNNRALGYKILGFVVWQVGKWYAHRRYPGAARKLAIAGAAGAAGALIAAGGVVVASRRSASDEQTA
jgi:hypothetical protein